MKPQWCQSQPTLKMQPLQQRILIATSSSFVLAQYCFSISRPIYRLSLLYQVAVMLEIHSTISICHSDWKCSHFGIACMRAHTHTLQRKTNLSLLHALLLITSKKASLFSKNWFLFYFGADYFNDKKFESLNWEYIYLNLQFIWNKVAQTKYKFILLHRGNFFLNLTKKNCDFANATQWLSRNLHSYQTKVWRTWCRKWEIWLQLHLKTEIPPSAHSTS